MDLKCKRIFPYLLALLAYPAVLEARAVTPVRDGGRLESACKLQDMGDSIASHGLLAEGGLKISAPSSVLPENTAIPIVQVEGWNAAPQAITPTDAAAAR